MVSFQSALLIAFAACAVASPVAEPVAEANVTPAPDAALVKRATSCTFSGSNGASSASKSQKSCSTIVLSGIAVPSGTTLSLSDLPDDTTVSETRSRLVNRVPGLAKSQGQVIFEGETTWGYEEWDGPLLQIEGTGITITGASGAYLNPDGSRWWDGEGSNGGKTKPKFFAAHNLISSTITDMTIDNSAGDSAGAANTDGFDIGDSSNVVINGANVYNQDDCVAINSGTDITVENSVCSGGHGLSIGSVGGRSDNTVQTVTFNNNEVKSSVNGIRIKATEGDTGTISGVTYSEITLESISKYGIIIEQNYDGGDLKGSPTSGIPITDLTIKNIAGSDAVSSSGYNIVIVCGSGACSDWTWSDVTVTGGQTYGSCENVPSGISCS